MGAIINSSQFVGTIYIDTSDVETKNDLELNYCPFVEEKMLKSLLGITLYNDYLSNKTESKYTNLINGVAAYTYNGKTRLYTGVKKMLAYFTYFEFVPDMTTVNTKSGQKIMKVKNSDPVVDKTKLIRAWNEGVRLYNEAIDYINYINDETPDTYEDFDPETLGTINIYGI